MEKKAKQVIVLSIALFFSVMVCSLFAWGDDDIVSSNNYNYDALTSPSNVWCVAASKDTAHSVWTFDLANDEAWYARSTDNTETWGTFKELSDNLSGYSIDPSIATVGDTVHTVWENRSSTYRTRIYYMKSTDKGANWGSPVNIADDTTNYKHNPCVRATGSYVYVTWRDWCQGSTLFPTPGSVLFPTFSELNYKCHVAICQYLNRFFHSFFSILSCRNYS